MIFNEEPNYYDILEIGSDASPQEIRDAYLRAKGAYKKDSVALYSLMSHDETESLLTRIEEAYTILSHPERRRQYDMNHGFLEISEEADRVVQRSKNYDSGKVVSIDRVPPMESMDGEADILVPPTTDFDSAQKNSSERFASSGMSPLVEPDDSDIIIDHTKPKTPVPPPPPAQANGAPAASTPSNSPSWAPPPINRTPHSIGNGRSLSKELSKEIEDEVEWTGTFVRKLRDARNISLEELSEHTKISKTYLNAIEEEDYTKLPAPVYLRGFLIQIARFLKLPAERLTSAYLTRYNQNWSDKGRNKGR